VQALGAPQAVAEDGVRRIKCKVLSSGEEGWVTLSGNSGKQYFDEASPFKEFTKELRDNLKQYIRKTTRYSTSSFRNIKILPLLERKAILT
jgi:hypothetical protein